MSNKTTIIAAWSLSVAAAFAVGYIAKPTSGDTIAGNAAAAGAPVIATDTGGTITERAARAAAAKNGTPGAASPELSIANLSGEALQQTIKSVLDINDPVERDRKFLELLSQLTPENAADFADAVRRTRGFGPGRDNRDKLGLVLNAWAKLDGEAAMEYATAEREDGGRRGPGGRGGGWPGSESFSALSGWASADPDAAKAWLDGQEELEGREKGMLTAALIEGMISTDPDSAMAYISSLPADNEGRGRYTAMIAGEKLEQGLPSALAWFDSISDPSLKSGAAFRIAMDYGREDPAAAAAWAADSGERGALSMTVRNWVRDDLDGSIDWALKLEGENQATAFDAIFDRWADDDPTAASEFLVGMKDGEGKDAAVRSLAREISREDPQSALTWASSIGDTESRTETVESLARDWVRRDEDAAALWLAEADLPAESLEKILAPQEDNRRGEGRGGRDFGGGRGGGGRGGR